VGDMDSLHVEIDNLNNPLVGVCFIRSIDYSLRPILLFANTDVSTTKICLDITILAKGIMDRREYHKLVY
jgi:hypothetical protein